MKRLLGYLKEHLCVTILAPLFKMLEASFELFVPLVVASMIDVGIGHHDIGYLWKMGGLLILLGIIGFSFSITAQYFAARSAVYTGKSMRSDLFAHMNQFSYQEIDQVGTSTLINRMSNDINQVQNGVNMFLRLFLRSPFVVFGAMFMAFTVDHKAAVSFVFTITALAVVVGLILWITMPMYKKVQKQVDGVLKSTRENLLGIRVIRAFNRQRSEEENFRVQSGQLYSKQIHVGKISALLNPLTYMIINLGIIAILWSGGKQVDLSLKEFDLLYLLAGNRGRVFSREILLEKIWGYDYAGDSATVMVHINRIREKIEDDSKNPKILETVWGAGYRLNKH